MNDLLKPRYKVIADFPGSATPIGFTIEDIEYYRSKFNIEDYPHIFRKLEWWEERKPEDMPEYVKSIGGNLFAKIVYPGPPRFYAFFPSLGERHTGFYKDYLPATRPNT